MVLAGLLALLPAAMEAKGKPRTPSPEDPARLAAETASYRKQLDLASGGGFYYILDPKQRLLRFLFQGNLLVEYRLLDLEIRGRRGLFGSGSAPEGWADRVWSDGRLDPARRLQPLELDTSAENYEEAREATLVPPTPAEAFPAPSVWHIRYPEGLTLEIWGVDTTRVTRTRPGFFSRLAREFGDALNGLGFSGEDTLRLRLYLASDEADAFYRSVPPATRFAVLNLY